MNQEIPAPVSVRPLPAAEHRGAVDLFQLATHEPPTTEDGWSVLAGAVDPEGFLGAFRDGELVGVCQSTPNRVRVPGNRLPARIVGRFAVRPGHARHGVGTALLRTFLGGCREPVVLLRASEGGIYGRFGFGVATWARHVVVDRRQAALAEDAPSGGRVRVVGLETAAARLPELYRRMRTRPGMVERPDYFAELYRLEARSSPAPLLVAIHTGPDGDDGFALYFVRGSMSDRAPRRVLDVADLQYASAASWAGLCRFLLGVDLVDEVALRGRPPDEPTEWLFADPRTCRTEQVQDEVWLRLVDVPAALAARGYGCAEPVVLGVRDALLPANTGQYRICHAGVRRTDQPPDLIMDVQALAALYLGGTRPSALAAAGRIAVHADVLSAADRLFTTPQAPWCGTSI